MAMAFKRLQAHAAAGVPDLNHIIARRRRQLRRIVREGYREDPMAMAFKRLQAHATAGVPDLDRAVMRR